MLHRDDFSSFDKESVLKLVIFYPSDFSNIDLMDLECQLDLFIGDMRSDEDFRNLRDISSLLVKLVETKKKDVAYSRVALLIKLILILPVATASVERVFSGMTFVKNKLRNRIGDQPDDCLVTYIEKKMFLQVSDDDIAIALRK